MPEELDGYIVQSLGSALFSNNTTLKKISLPYTLETVEGDIFNGCKSLKSISFTDETTTEADGLMQELCGKCSGVITEKVITKLIYGDLDRDGTVNALDLSVIRKALTGTAELDKYQIMVIDINGDSVIDIRDLVSLKKALIS